MHFFNSILVFLGALAVCCAVQPGPSDNQPPHPPRTIVLPPRVSQVTSAYIVQPGHTNNPPNPPPTIVSPPQVWIAYHDGNPQRPVQPPADWRQLWAQIQNRMSDTPVVELSSRIRNMSISDEPYSPDASDDDEENELS